MRVAVVEERELWVLEVSVVVVGRNWKSARRRSAHLLAEQQIVVEGLKLERFVKCGSGVSIGVLRPMVMCLKASILSFLFEFF